MEDKHYALLIDSDNVSSKYIYAIIDELTKYGTITYRRIYGDWTKPQSAKWKDILLKNAITPVQQFRNTVGKNATDATLIIDAMDILYTGSVDGFCIISSDSDFTRLAGRLREAGKEVIGMGEQKTPRAFRAACDVFTSLELLMQQQDEEEEEEIPITITNYTNEDNDESYNSRKDEEESKRGEVLHQSVVENVIIQILSENNDKGKITELGEIGGRLQKKYSDFDVRNYGYSTLSQFIEDSDELKIDKVNTTCIINLKNTDTLKKDVIDFIRKSVEEAGEEGIDVGNIGQQIHQRFPAFNSKTFGYSTLSKFVSVIDGLEIHEHLNGRKFLTKGK